MRKLLYLVLLTQLFSSFALAQSQTDGGLSKQSPEIQEAVRLNAQVAELYKQGKYNEALQVAQRELALREKLFGAEDKQTAPVLFNLGAIYQERKDYKQSIAYFERALAIYRQTFGDNNPKVFATINEIAVSSFLKGDKAKSITHFQNALTISEKLFGAESKGTAAQVLRLADVHANLGQRDEAERFYLRAIEINDKIEAASSQTISETEEPEERADVDRYYCFLNSNYELEQALKKYELLDEKRDAKRAQKRNLVEDGVVNGKARKLIQPAYPSEAKQARLQGIAIVRVTINSNGDVESAKAICGDPIFATTSAEAARLSKFTPTLRDGKPIKVTGVIIYRFVGR